jgi:ribonuclease-3
MSGDSDTKTAELARVGELFGLRADGDLFSAAITHPSYAHEDKSCSDNQRLEFLGDAILDFLVSENLYARYNDWDEGKLTRTRSQLVSTGALARFARHHELAKAIRFGKGAGQGGLEESDNVLADAVEALLAATYLENGLPDARKIALDLMDFGLSRVQEAGARDAKSELQEKVQAIGLRAPTYQVVSAEGPAHDVTFEVEVAVHGTALGRGRGRSKRVAERNAARKALEEESYRTVIEPSASEEESP